MDKKDYSGYYIVTKPRSYAPPWPKVAGLEIATDTVANASKNFFLATKNSGLVATLATIFRSQIKD